MPKLIRALRAWKSADFGHILQDDLKKLGHGVLPLHQGTRQGGLVDDSNLGITIISATDDDGLIRLKIGTFFTEIVGGCNCADDPVEVNAYCELQVIIDRSSAEADIKIF